MKSQRYDYLEELDGYFASIRNIKPLTRKEENELAVKIRIGQQAEERLKTLRDKCKNSRSKSLSAEMDRLVKVMSDGEAALNKLVRANLKFVVSVAKKYRDSGVAFSDLIEDGNMGLVKAAQRFDETKGVKFISYAVWWVRRCIQECIEQHQAEEAVNADDYLLDNTTEQDYGEALLHDDDSEFEENYMVSQGRQASIEDMMSCLRKRERRILEMYFGLDDGREKTLDEIGQETQLTKERVRQIKDKALIKLKTHALMSDEFDTFSELR